MDCQSTTTAPSRGIGCQRRGPGCRRRAIALCAALFLVAAAAPAARAQEAKPGPAVKVAGLSFKGVEQVDERVLRSVLATRTPGWLPWSDKPAFSRVDFEADLHRIRAFYVDRGFPDAQVASFDIDLNEAGDEVELTVTVEEGRPTLVTGVRLEGFDAVPEGRLRRLRRRLIRTGQPLDRVAVATARETLADELRNHGYPFPRVTARLDPGATEHEVAITLSAVPGEVARFGELVIAGAREVDESIVRRSLLFEPGDLYRRNAIQETQRKLYSLELFEFVNVTPVREGQPEGAADRQGGAGADRVSTVPMRVTLTEGKHRRVRLSAGYGTEEKARTEAQYRQLNFLGGARSVGLHAKWSSLDRGFRGDFLQPFVFGPRWSLSVTGQRWYSDEPMYRAIQSGGHTTLTYSPGLQTSFSLTATTVYQSSRISREALADLSLRPTLIALGLDPRTGGQDGTLTALSFDIRRNTSQPNPLNAFRGYSIDVHLERAGGPFRGSYHYSNASLDVRHYLRVPVGRGIVLATRAQAGSIAPDGGVSARVPFAKRYFLGGSTSLRGWGRYEVSPLSGSGLPLGGFSMFQATVEARVRLWGQLGAVAFLDAGNVWEDEWQLRLRDFRYAAGPGLRYITPAGPVRVDLGYQLNPIPGLLVGDKREGRHWRIHFSIGQAF